MVLATPLIERLKESLPGSEVHFLLRKGNDGLLTGHPKLSKLWVWDKKQKWKSLLKLSFALRKEKFDLVVNLQRFASSGIITVLSGGKETRGFAKNPLSFFFTKKYPHELKEGVHEVDRNLSLLEGIADSSSKQRPVLYPSTTDYKRVEQYKTETYFCLAPASIWFTKQWPKEKWVELSQKLKQLGAVYLLGGPADTALCEEIRLEAGGEPVNLAGKLSLLQTAALMQDARMNYVNDSAPMHLASSVNAPVTAIYCSTIPEFGFGPLSDISIVSEVKGLYCRPCGLHGHKACPEGHFRCGFENDVKVE